MNNFYFLQDEWRELYDAALKAETAVLPDARTSCFYARYTLEQMIRWMYKADPDLHLPYQDNLAALMADPSFKKTVDPIVLNKMDMIRRLGNQASHSHKMIKQYDSLQATRELFHVAYWFARTYTQGNPPSDELTFDQALLPQESASAPKTLPQVQSLQESLTKKDEALTQLMQDKNNLDAELQELRKQIAAAKASNEQQPDNHNYSEAQTRDYFIDLLLHESGWPLDQDRDREYPVVGMPNDTGEGFVDYVLWGDDGLPLAVVEAKRTKVNPLKGQQQAVLYADCLETMTGQRPLIYYSNGFEHWMWDDQFYPPRSVQGFLKKDELQLAIQRRKTRQKLASIEINDSIVERHYQHRAIRRIGETFEVDHQRKALIVMATGAGKTRTVIALVDLLMRANWAKRILFLADRIALVNQAVGAFKDHLPGTSPVDLRKDKNAEGRVYVATYPTMMGLIDDTSDGQRRFGVGHFDLVIIDEAHRSVYQKYRAIFEYFDSLLVGLTATPKDEVDRNTYDLFGLEPGVPTDSYGLDEAVEDGYLVPAQAVSVPLKFQREGIRYDQLSDEEKERWDALEWSEGEIPDHVTPEELDRWLFNQDTVDKVLRHLMTNGQKVAGGDRLGKTIIFAKNHKHAEFIVSRFDANYPKLMGKFARVVDYEVNYVQDLIDKFGEKEKDPHIAVSVDMLDTGIDIPEVVNLVFYKMVRSKTKFWQMVGRGTRLCPDLFSPGEDKESFFIFDYCQNLEFFNQNPDTTEGSSGESLRTRLFKHRLELIVSLDKQDSSPDEMELRFQTATRLREEVAAMNTDNFVVRPHRALVDRFSNEEIWSDLSTEDVADLMNHIAFLPSEYEDDEEDAKRFDLLVYRLMLAQINIEPFYEKLRDQVREIAGLLEEKHNIPMVAAQIELIQDLQTDPYWEGITLPMLEQIRKRLRGLVKLIDKQNRKPVYSNFEDQLGQESVIELTPQSAGVNQKKYTAKVRQFLRQNLNHIAIQKIRTNVPLNETDISELERFLTEAGIATTEELDRIVKEAQSLEHFIKSLVGMDRATAKRALADFLVGETHTSHQIEFINLIIDYLTEHGSIEFAKLYESPFTDISPKGPEGIFREEEISLLAETLKSLSDAPAA